MILLLLKVLRFLINIKILCVKEIEHYKLLNKNYKIKKRKY